MHEKTGNFVGTPVQSLTKFSYILELWIYIYKPLYTKPATVCKAVVNLTFADQDFLKTVIWHYFSSSYASNNVFFQCRESRARIPQSCTKFKSSAQWSCINVDCSTEGTAIHNAASGDVIKLTSEKWVSFLTKSSSLTKWCEFTNAVLDTSWRKLVSTQHCPVNITLLTFELLKRVNGQTSWHYTSINAFASSLLDYWI